MEQNNNNTQQEKQSNFSQPKEIDFLKLYMSNTSIEEAEEIEGVPIKAVFNNDLDGQFERYQKGFAGQGININRQDFEKIFNEAKNTFVQMKKNKQDDFMSVTTRQPKTTDLQPRLFGFDDNTTSYVRPASPMGIRTPFGGFIQQRTAEQIAFSAGVYVDKDGEEKSIWQYEALHGAGIATKKGEDGNDYLLTLGSDMQGRPMLVEKRADDILRQSTVVSMFGPQKMTESWMNAFGTGVYNSLIDFAVSTPGSLAETLGTAIEYFIGDDTAMDHWQAWGNNAQNLSGIYKSKKSIALEQASLFDGGINLLALSNGVGSVIGQLLPIIAGGYLGGGAAAGLGLFSSASKIAQGLGRAMQWLPSIGWASAFAADAFNQEAKEMGISQEDRAGLYGAAFLATAISEMVVGRALGGTNLAEGYLLGVAMKSDKEMLRRAARPFIQEYTKAQTKEAKKGAIKGMANSFAKWMSSTKKGRLGNMTSAMIEESSEEIIQGVMETGIKKAYDYHNTGKLNEDGSVKKKNNGLFGASEMSIWEGWKENAFLGAIGGAIPGVFHKGKENAKEQIEKYFHVYAAVDLELSLEDHIKYFDEIIEESGGYNFLDPDGNYIGNDTSKSAKEVAREIGHQQIRLVHETIKSLKASGKGSAQAIGKLMGGDTALFREAVNALFVAQGYKNKLQEGNLSEEQRLEYEDIVAKSEKHAEDILSGKLYGEYLALSKVQAHLFNRFADGTIDDNDIYVNSFGQLLGRRHVQRAFDVNKLYQERRAVIDNLSEEELVKYHEQRQRKDKAIETINKTAEISYDKYNQDNAAELDQAISDLLDVTGENGVALTAEEIQNIASQLESISETEALSLLEMIPKDNNNAAIIESIETSEEAVSYLNSINANLDPEVLDALKAYKQRFGRNQSNKLQSISGLNESKGNELYEAGSNVLDAQLGIVSDEDYKKRYEALNLEDIKNRQRLKILEKKIAEGKKLTDAEKIQHATLKQNISDFEQFSVSQIEEKAKEDGTSKEEIAKLRDAAYKDYIKKAALETVKMQVFEDIIKEAGDFGDISQFLSQIKENADNGVLSNPKQTLEQLNELADYLDEVLKSFAINKMIQEEVGDGKLNELALKALNAESGQDRTINESDHGPYMDAVKQLQSELYETRDAVLGTKNLKAESLNKIKTEYEKIERHLVTKLATALKISFNDDESTIAIQEKIRAAVEKDPSILFEKKKVNSKDYTVFFDWIKEKIFKGEKSHKEYYVFKKAVKDVLIPPVSTDGKKQNASTRSSSYDREPGLLSNVDNFTFNNFIQELSNIEKIGNSFAMTVATQIIFKTVSLNQNQYNQSQLNTHEEINHGLSIEQDLSLQSVAAWDQANAIQYDGTSLANALGQALALLNQDTFESRVGENAMTGTMLFLDGVAGGGKSYAIKHAIEIMLLQAKGRGQTNNKIVLVAQSEQLRKELLADITTYLESLSSLKGYKYEIEVVALDDYNKNADNYVNDITIIDESTLLTIDEINNLASKNNRILLSGDTSQVSDLSITVDLFASINKTWRITQSNRTGLEDLSMLQDLYRMHQQSDKIALEPRPHQTRYFDQEGKRKGVRIFKNNDELTEHIKQVIATAEANNQDLNMAVIVATEEELALLPPELKPYGKTLERGDNSVQGLTFDEAYMFEVQDKIQTLNGPSFTKGPKNNDYTIFNKLMLTGLTRAKSYLAFVDGKAMPSVVVERESQISNKVIDQEEMAIMNKEAIDRYKERLNIPVKQEGQQQQGQEGQGQQQQQGQEGGQDSKTNTSQQNDTNSNKETTTELKNDSSISNGSKVRVTGNTVYKGTIVGLFSQDSSNPNNDVFIVRRDDTKKEVKVKRSQIIILKTSTVSGERLKINNSSTLTGIDAEKVLSRYVINALHSFVHNGDIRFSVFRNQGQYYYKDTKITTDENQLLYDVYLTFDSIDDYQQFKQTILSTYELLNPGSDAGLSLLKDIIEDHTKQLEDGKVGIYYGSNKLQIKKNGKDVSFDENTSEGRLYSHLANEETGALLTDAIEDLDAVEIIDNSYSGSKTKTKTTTRISEILEKLKYILSFDKDNVKLHSTIQVSGNINGAQSSNTVMVFTLDGKLDNTNSYIEDYNSKNYGLSPTPIHVIGNTLFVKARQDKINISKVGMFENNTFYGIDRAEILRNIINFNRANIIKFLKDNKQEILNKSSEQNAQLRSTLFDAIDKNVSNQNTHAFNGISYEQLIEMLKDINKNITTFDFYLPTIKSNRNNVDNKGIIEVLGQISDLNYVNESSKKLFLDYKSIPFKISNGETVDVYEETYQDNQYQDTNQNQDTNQDTNQNQGNTQNTKQDTTQDAKQDTKKSDAINKQKEIESIDKKIETLNKEKSDIEESTNIETNKKISELENEKKAAIESTKNQSNKKSSLPKELDPEVDLEKEGYTVIYHASPNGKGEWLHRNRTPEVKRGATIYKFFVSSNGEVAYFEFYNQPSTFNSFLDDYLNRIDPVSNVKNVYDSKSTNVKTVKRGRAVLKNGTWVMVEKMEHFYETESTKYTGDETNESSATQEDIDKIENEYNDKIDKEIKEANSKLKESQNKIDEAISELRKRKSEINEALNKKQDTKQDTNPADGSESKSSTSTVIGKLNPEDSNQENPNDIEFKDIEFKESDSKTEDEQELEILKEGLTISQAVDILNSIIGEEATLALLESTDENGESIFVEFKKLNKKYGKQIFGVMAGGNVPLQIGTSNGKVHRFTPVHEVVHFIEKYLLKRSSRIKLLKTAFKAFKNDYQGLTFEEVYSNPKLLHSLREKIAERSERYLMRSKPNNKYEEALDKLSDFATRIRALWNAEARLEAFYGRVNSGYYQKAALDYINGFRFYGNDQMNAASFKTFTVNQKSTNRAYGNHVDNIYSASSIITMIMFDSPYYNSHVTGNELVNVDDKSNIFKAMIYTKGIMFSEYMKYLGAVYNNTEGYSYRKEGSNHIFTDGKNEVVVTFADVLNGRVSNFKSVADIVHVERRFKDGRNFGSKTHEQILQKRNPRWIQQLHGSNNYNKSDFEYYTYYASLVDNEIFLGLMQRAFQGVDVKRTWNQRTSDVHTLAAQDSIDTKDAGEVNIMERASDIIKGVIYNTRYNRNGKTNRKVDSILALEIINYFGNQSHHPADESEVNMSKIERMGKRMKEYLDKNDLSNAEYLQQINEFRAENNLPPITRLSKEDKIKYNIRKNQEYYQNVRALYDRFFNADIMSYTGLNNLYDFMQQNQQENGSIDKVYKMYNDLVDSHNAGLNENNKITRLTEEQIKSHAKRNGFPDTNEGLYNAFMDIIEKQMIFNSSVMSALGKLAYGNFDSRMLKMNVKSNDYGVTYTPIYRDVSASAEIKADLIDKINGELLNGEMIDKQMITDRFVKGFHFSNVERNKKGGKSNPIRLKVNGNLGTFELVFNDGKEEHVVATYKNGGFRFIQERDIMFSKKDFVKYALKNFGIHLKNKHINNLVQTKGDITFTPSLNNVSFLNTIIDMYMSAYMYGATEENEISTLRDAIVNRHGRYYGKTTLNEVFNKDVKEDGSKIESDYNDQFYFPTAFFNEIDVIAKAMSLSGSVTNSFSYDTKGSKIMDRQIGNFLTHFFGINERGKKTNEGLVKEYQRIGEQLFKDYTQNKSNYIENQNINIRIDDSGRGYLVVNPLLDGGIKVQDRFSRYGTRINKSKGKDYAQLNFIDLMDYLVGANVYEAKTGFKSLVVHDENQGDRKTQDSSKVSFNLSGIGRSNGIYIIDESVVDDRGELDLTNEAAIKIDYSNIYELLNRRFEIQRIAQIHSLNRIARALGIQERLQPHDKQNYLIEIDDYVKEITNALNRLNNNYVNAKEFMKGKELYTVKDIIINRDGTMSIGKDASFNTNEGTISIYNFNAYKNIILGLGPKGEGNRSIRNEMERTDALLEVLDGIINGNQNVQVNENQNRSYASILGKVINNFVSKSGFNNIEELNTYQNLKDLFVTISKTGEQSIVDIFNGLDNEVKDKIRSLVSDNYNNLDPYNIETTLSVDKNKENKVKQIFNASFEILSDEAYKRGYTVSDNIKSKSTGRYIRNRKTKEVNKMIEATYYAHHFYNEFFMAAALGTEGEYKDIQTKNKRLSLMRSPFLPLDTSNRFGVDKIANTWVVEDDIIFGKYRNRNDNTMGEVEMQDGLAFTTLVHRYLLHNSHGQQVGGNNIKGSMKDVQYAHDTLKSKTTNRKRSVDTITEMIVNSSPDMEMYMERMLNPRGLNEGSLYHVLQDYISQGMSFDEASKRTALEYAKNRNVKNSDGTPKYEMVAYLEFKSSKKENAQKNVLNKQDILNGKVIGNEWNKYTNNHDHTQGGIQLEPYRDTDNSNETKPSQIMNIILGTAANSELSNEMQQIIADIAYAELDNILSKYEEDLAQATTEVQKRKVLAKYVRNIVKGSMSQATESTNILELLTNPNVNIDFPSIEAKAVSYIGSEITKKAIKFKMPGMRLNESKINMKLYDWNGLVWNRKELELQKEMVDDPAQKAEIDKVLLGQGRQLKNFRYKIRDDRYYEVISTVGRLIRENDDIKNDLLNKITAAFDGNQEQAAMFFTNIIQSFNATTGNLDVDLPITQTFELSKALTNSIATLTADYKSKIIATTEDFFYKMIVDNKSAFNLVNANDTLLEARKGEAIAPAHQFSKYNIPKRMSFNELFTMFIGGKAVNVRVNQMTEQEVIDSFNNVIDFLNSNELIKQYYNKIQRANKDKSENALMLMTYREYMSAVKNISQSVDKVIAVRTPSTNASSGSYMQIVGFSHDNGNNLYTSPLRMLLDGHDNDIDQATLYFNTLNEEQNNKQVDVLKSQLINKMFEYYEDANNDLFTMQAIDMDEIIATSESKVNSMRKKLLNSDLFTTMFNKSSSIDGKVVGPFAQFLKVFSNVAASSAKMKKNGLDVKGLNSQIASSFDMSFEQRKLLAEVSATLGNYGNAATDNAKLNVLGTLDISIINAYMVGAMIMNQEATIKHAQYLENEYAKKVGRPSKQITSAVKAINYILNNESHKELIKKIHIYDSARENRTSNIYQAIVQMYESDKRYADQNKEKLEKLKEKLIEAEKDLMVTLGSFNVKEKATKNYFNAKELFEQRKALSNTLKIRYGFDYKIYSGNASLGEDIDEKIEMSDYEEWKLNVVAEINADGTINKKEADRQIKEFEGLIKKYEEINESIEESGETHKDYKKGNYKYKAIQRQIRYYERKDTSYLANSFFMAQMAIAADASRNSLAAFNLDQGLPNKENELNDAVMDLEYLVGMGLNDFLELYNEYRNITSDVGRNNFMQNYNNEEMLTKRIAFSNSMYEKRTANEDINKLGWRNYELKFNGESVVYSEEVHRVYNIMPMLFERQDIMSYIAALQKHYEIVNGAFFSNNSMNKRMFERIRKENGYDKLYDEQYYTLKHELSNFYIDKFLKTAQSYNKKGSSWRQIFHGVALNENAPSVELDTAQGRQSFIRNFPSYFINEMESVMMKYENLRDNQFFANIEVVSNEKTPFLVFSNAYALTDERLALIKSDFLELPIYMQRQLAYYQLVKDGFDHRKGGFSKILPDNIYQEYSGFLQDFQNKLDNDDAFADMIEKELNETFHQYLLSNTKLGLTRKFNKNNEPLTEHFTTDVKINGRKVQMYMNKRKDGEGRRLHSIYAYPNFALPYDGNPSNAITSMVGYAIDTEGNENVNSKDIKTHPVYGISNQQHQSHVREYYSQVSGNQPLELTITFANDVSYTRRHTLRFADGFIGEVLSSRGNVLKYKLMRPDSQKYITYLTRLETFQVDSFVKTKRTTKTIEKMIKAAEVLFPELNINVISQNDIERKLGEGFFADTFNSLSFIYNGQLYIVKERITPETFIEEMGHLFGVIIEEQNKDLFVQFTDALIGSSLDLEIRNRYNYSPNTENENELRLWRHEAFAQAIRLRYVDRLMTDINNEVESAMVSNVQENQPNNLRDEVWRAISVNGKAIVETLISNNFYGTSINSDALRVKMFGDADTFGQLSDNIIDLFFSAMVNRNASMSEDLRQAMFSIDTGKLKTAFGENIISAKDFDAENLNNLTINDLGRLFRQEFKRDQSDKDIFAKNKRINIINGLHNQLLNARKNNKDYIVYSSYEGKTYRFPILTLSSIKDIEALVDEKIIPIELQAFESSTSNMINFLTSLSEGANILQAALSTVKQRYSETEDDNNLLKVQRDAISMVNLIDFNPNTDKVYLSNNNDLINKGIKIPQAFQNENTAIIVHADNSFSVVQISALKLNAKGVSSKNILNEIIYDDEGNILESVVSEDIIKENDIQLTQMIKDVAMVQNTLIAMAIKSNNENIRLNGLFVLKNDQSINKNTNTGFQFHTEQVDVMLNAVEKIMNIDIIKNALAPEVKAIVESKSLYDAKRYKQDPLKTLMANIEGFLNTNDASNKKSEFYLNEIKELLTSHRSPGGKNSYKLMYLLERRRNFLKDRYGNDTKALNELLEYRLIVDAYTYLNRHHNLLNKKIDNINTINKFLRDPNKYESELLQYLEQEISITNKNIERYVFDFNKVHNSKVAAIMKEKNINRTLTALDKSSDIFGNLFKQVTGVDKNGNTITFNSHEIHWEVDILYEGKKIEEDYDLLTKWINGEIKNEDVTMENTSDEIKDLLRSGKLTTTELLYGRWVMDALEYNFIKNMQYENGLQGETKLEQYNFTKDILSNKWKKGMLPAMPTKLSESITKLIRKEDRSSDVALRALMRSTANFDTIFDDVYEETQYTSAITNPFLLQFQTDGATTHGSEKRARMIGVEKTINGSHVHYDYYSGDGKSNNSNLTNNIQDILNYSVLASKRAIEFNKRVVPVFEHIESILEFEGVSKGKKKKAKNILDMAKTYYDRNVLGEVQELEGHLRIGKKKLNPNKSIIAAVTYSSMSMLGFSPRIAVRSALGIGFEMATKSLVNDMVDNGFFGKKDLSRAVSEILSNRHLATALNHEVFHVTNMDERSLLRHRENIVSKRHMVQSDIAHIINFYGEHGMRLVSMVAQMIKEGSYDAYSLNENLELVYDETKDKRMYDDNGNITNFGKQIKNDLRLEFEKEGGTIWSRNKEREANEGKILYGHSWRDAESYKAQADIFYSQGMTADTKSSLANYVLGVPLLQFATFLTNKTQLWTQAKYKSGKIGFRQFNEEEGAEFSKWDQLEMQGIIHIFTDSMKRLKETKSLSGTWESLSPMDKSMLAYGMTDIMLVGLTMFLTALLLGGEDDEEVNPAVEYFAEKIVAAAIYEKKANILLPFDLYNRIENPIVAKELIKAPFDLITALGDIDNENQLRNIYKESTFMLPGGVLLRDMLPFFEYYLSEN